MQNVFFISNLSYMYWSASICYCCSLSTVGLFMVIAASSIKCLRWNVECDVLPTDFSWCHNKDVKDS